MNEVDDYVAYLDELATRAMASSEERIHKIIDTMLTDALTALVQTVAANIEQEGQLIRTIQDAAHVFQCDTRAQIDALKTHYSQWAMKAAEQVASCIDVSRVDLGLPQVRRVTPQRDPFYIYR